MVWRVDVLGFIVVAMLTLASTAAMANGERKAMRELPGNLVGHGGPVHAVQLSADRTRALTGSFDYTMMYWDVSSDVPKLLRRFDQHDGPVKALAFLPGDTRAVSSGDDGIVRLWDLEAGTLLQTFKGHQNKVVALAVRADGKRVASASWDRTVRVWTVSGEGKPVVLKGHQGPVQSVAFSLDGTQVVSAGYDGTIRLWNVKTGTPEGVIHKHGVGINVIKRLPGRDQIAFGAFNGTGGLLDLKTGQVVREFEAITGPVLAMAVQPKPGLFAIGGSGNKGRGGSLRIFRIGDWSLLETFTNPFGPIWAADFGANGASVYYGGLDDFVSRWQVAPRKPFEVVQGKFPRRFQVSERMSLGERQFARKCSVCHTLEKDGKNRAGPSLYKLFGRKIGTLPGYPYSDALKKMDIIWTAETVGRLFDEGPDHFTPGSKMPLQRIADAKARNALIAYLVKATDPERAARDKN